MVAEWHTINTSIPGRVLICRGLFYIYYIFYECKMFQVATKYYVQIFNSIYSISPSIECCRLARMTLKFLVKIFQRSAEHSFWTSIVYFTITHILAPCTLPHSLFAECYPFSAPILTDFLLSTAQLLFLFLSFVSLEY